MSKGFTEQGSDGEAMVNVRKKTAGCLPLGDEYNGMHWYF